MQDTRTLSFCRCLSQMVTKLADFSSKGARGVVVFLTPKDTERFLRAVKLGEQVGLLKPQQLVLLGSTGWGDNTDIVS